jgi:hypothetical protein
MQRNTRFCRECEGQPARCDHAKLVEVMEGQKLTAHV